MMDDAKLDLGSIQIHKKVLADIALTALKDVEGVTLASEDCWENFVKFFNKDVSPGVTVTVDKENQVTIEIKVVVRYGINIPDAARKTQEVIRTAIEKAVDLHLKEVHVGVQGIERGTHE